MILQTYLNNPSFSLYIALFVFYRIITLEIEQSLRGVNLISDILLKKTLELLSNYYCY